ncbi:hypothetical protein [Psychromonas aquimarina]|uniref:hypothetical protein n=1 Tax=Psychromonas aquimarina TaxID=444919 RepID=UPI00041854F9|nr:hypothetical protein [Psychromonas aquimarina]
MNIRILISLLFLFFAKISFAENYVLTIGKESYELSLDKEVRIKVGEHYVSAKLKQKDYLTYTTGNFSFEYPKQYSPSKSDLGGGIFQTAMMTPLGTVVLIQEYTNIDPSSLLDLMINEVTKEEREYGYKLESRPLSTTLSDGTVLNGKVVTSKYKGSDIERLFYTYGIKDSGLLIMTQIDYEIASSGDEDVINRLIKSLKVTMK